MIISLYLISALCLGGIIIIFRNRIVNQLVTLIFFGAELGISIYAFRNLGAEDSVYFRFDSIGVILSMVLTLLLFATFYHSRIYFQRHPSSKRNESIYYMSLIFLAASMTAAYFAEHLGVLWACIEATTLSVAYLIYHERTEHCIEATWKYIFVSSIGIAIAFAGILFLGMAAHDKGVKDLDLSQIIAIAGEMDPLLLKISFVLVLTGYSAKMGLFPLHTIAVDAHAVAPPPISALISTALMNVGFLGIYRVYLIIAQTDSLPWAQNVLMIAGMFSIFVASVQLLKVKHFKRMFAFSSAEHMGIIAIALAAGGIGYYAAILHLILHSLVKSSLFYQIGQTNSIYHSYWIRDSGRQIKLNPIGSIVMIIAFISITAMPPSGLFITEFMIFKSLFVAKQYFIVAVLFFLLSIIIYVFGKNLLHLLYYSGEETRKIESVKVNKMETATQFVFLGLAIYLGFHPPVFLDSLIKGAIEILRVKPW